jgi:hypothetical protein
MRQSRSRIGCALLAAFGVLGFSSSVAAAAEVGTASAGRASVGMLTPTAPSGSIVHVPLAR